MNNIKNPADDNRQDFLFCEKATKRCISGGKNDQKYGIYPFDKLEFVSLVMLS